MATIEEMQADLDALLAARQTRLLTGAVKEVSRDGRKLIYDNPSLADLNAAIDGLRRDIADAAALLADTSYSRYSALSVRF